MLVGLTDTVKEWESKEFSDANYSHSPKLRGMNNSRIRVETERSCFKKDEITFTKRNVINPFIVYN